MFSTFKNFPNITAAISNTTDGSMGRAGEVGYSENANREKFLAKYNIPMERMVCAELAHGNNTVIVSQADAGKLILETDGLLTNVKNLFLSVTVADCLPIFFFDPKKQAVGLVHTGWRGIVKKVPESLASKMGEVYGSQMEDILVSIGPHICAEHYEVKADVAEQFSEYGNSVIIEKQRAKYINLSQAVRAQLGSIGVKGKNISVETECTYSTDNLYFSYRRDKPKILETMLAVIGIKN